MNGLPAILLGTALIAGALVGYIAGYGRGWRRCEDMWQAEWDTREGSSIANHTPARFGTSTWNTAELPRRPAGATITDNLPADSYDGPPTKVLQQVLTGLRGMDLPPQHGTLPEHNRRLTALTPIAPSPVLRQVRVDTPATLAGGAMSGKYGAPAEAQSPPSTGGLAGPKPWLRWWPHDRALALAILGWWRLRDHLARTERHYWHDYETGRHRLENIGPGLLGTVAQRRHSAAAGQRAIHAALTTPTREQKRVPTAAQQPEIDDEDLRRITETWRAQTITMGAVW